MTTVTAPAELCRSVPFTFMRAVDDVTDGDGRTLAGYAAVFDQMTEIDSWEGTFLETIRKGAFRKTIRERTPVMQFDHGRHPLVGSIPIGRITQLREDDDGLYVEGRLSDNWLIEPVRMAIRDEAVDGMSFRFEVIRDEWRDNAGKLLKAGELSELLWEAGDRGPLVRTLIELKVRELGPVVFPAYDGTSVSVRAREMATTILGADEMRRGVRRALASDKSAVKFNDDVDTDLKREIAEAVLFFEPTLETRSVTETGENDTEPIEETREQDDDAPSDQGHPSDKDAPVTDHPSITDQERRRKYVRTAYVQRHAVGRFSDGYGKYPRV